MESQSQKIAKLEKINAALMERVERSTDQQGNAFSLFQTAINLEGQIRRRTSELTNALMRLEQTNRELNNAKDDAEQANLSKTRFLAAASHDVLQPLNAASLLLSALDEEQQTTKGKQLAIQLEHSLETINDVLRSLLDISRLDAGVVQPRFEQFAVQEIFDSLESDFRPIAAANNLDLRFRPCKVSVRSDRSMLRRILQNLVSNALRYTEQGGVLVCCRSRKTHILISVFDTGTGFDMANGPELFEEFHRAVAKHIQKDETKPGLGLGLSIVSRMCRTLGHKLQYNSQPGIGSSFSISLDQTGKLVEPGSQNLHSANTSKLQGVYGTKILLLENDTAVVEAMLELFDQWHCEVRHGCNADEAHQCLLDGWTPEVIIADQQLDDDDLGTDTVIALRKQLAAQQLPAIMITADPSENLKIFTTEHVIELMLKPVKPAQLRALLTHVVAETVRISDEQGPGLR